MIIQDITTFKFCRVWGSADIPTPRLFFAFIRGPVPFESPLLDTDDCADTGWWPARRENLTV